MPNFKPQVIDVAILVDAPRILHDYGKNNADASANSSNFSNYVQLGPNGEGVGYVYMVTTWWDAQGEGGSELSVFGAVGNKIRWRMQTLSMGGEAYGSVEKDQPPAAHQAFIRGFVFNRGGDCITAPVQKIETVDGWGLDATGKRIPKQIVDVYWEATVQKPGGTVIYHAPFNIVCNGCCDDGGGGGGGGGGSNCGGYQHDPFIHTS